MKFPILLAQIVLIFVAENKLSKCNGEKIILLSFFSSKSHMKVYEPLIVELANRGHSITTVTSIKSKPHKNIKEILGMKFESSSSMEEMNVFRKRTKQEHVSSFSFAHISTEVCRQYYQMQEVQNLIKEKYDLVFINAVMNECVYGLVYHLKAPFIILSPFPPLQWTSDATGTPAPASFVPNIFFGYSDQMNFFERLYNLFGQIRSDTRLNWFYLPELERIYRGVFGEETPSITQIRKNVSLILSNSHATLNSPRPFLPDVIEVGGMACQLAKPLPKELDDFLSSAGKEGVIYFSMGSIIDAQATPESFRKIFVNVFSKLKQKVLWKWEEEMRDLPENIKLAKWLPQQDVLGHPNVKMFITHGGLGSTVEAAYHGVPLVGIPMFSDQDTNMKQSTHLGYALTLEYRDLTEESLLESINKILNDPKYTNRAKELSSVYRDRPQNPLETAVYWTEYVMRHKGAKHLRSPTRDLNWFQYHSFDTVIFALSITLLVLYILVSTVRFTIRKFYFFFKKA